MTRLETQIAESSTLSTASPRDVLREFRGLLGEGVPLRIAGEAKHDPERLLSRAYAPAFKIELFDAVYYLGHVRQNPDLRLCAAYVMPNRNAQKPALHARVFYKDSSLIWRSASHFCRSESENWIGKGAVRPLEEDPDLIGSAEETTDLPLEIQTAVEQAGTPTGKVPRDDEVVALILRRGPNDRLEPYRDFSEPRDRAFADPRNRIHGGRPIARFTRRNDPRSLRFASGYEPDFGAKSILERTHTRSSLYGGRVRRFRLLSKNRRIQYLFMAGPKQAWIIPPQALTTEISSFGVRTIDAVAPDDLCIPGYEYHYLDDFSDPPEFVTQIPEGFAGAASAVDPSRGDASPWIEKLPVIAEFRRRLLGARGRR